MKKIIVAVFIIMLIPAVSFAGERVRGHWTDTNHDGIKDTYVQPHERTNPNSSRMDNYSYPGNYNPNTGQITPRSESPRETYPMNPNPYETQKRRNW
jgi:hypothetical protein